MTRYRFHWRDGSTSEADGYSVIEALMSLKRGEDALIQLLRFETVEP